MRGHKSTLIIMALIVIVGFYFNSQEEGISIFDFNPWRGGDIELELGVPQQHRLLSGYATQNLPVVLRIVNRTDDPHILRTNAPCKNFRYVITTSEGEFVQSAGQDTKTPCTDTLTQKQLEVGEAFEELRQVPLDASRYVTGDYKLRIRYWHHEAQANIRLLAPSAPSAPAAP